MSPTAAVVTRFSGDVLFFQGEPTDFVYQVLSGVVRLHKLLLDGRRQVTGFVSAGHFLAPGEDGLCQNTAAAVTEVSVGRIRLEAFRSQIEGMPGFARSLLAATCDEVRVAQDQMLLLGRKSAIEKMASFLLALSRQQGDADKVDLPMARGDIADYLGMSIETVSRTLARLRAGGSIATPSVNAVEILDRFSLAAIAVADDAFSASSSRLRSRTLCRADAR
jgi:CRP/FNR family transcriptional regulator